jgi:hypothetical protein
MRSDSCTAVPLIGVIMSFMAIQPDLGAWQVRAKNIDYTPDITSNSYWNDHSIALIEISHIARNDKGALLVTYTVTQMFTSASLQSPRTAPASEFWFGGDEAPNLTEHQALVVYESKRGKQPLVASEAHDTEVTALRTISRLRMEPGATPAVEESVFDKNDLVSRYSLRRLLSVNDFQAPRGYVARLAQLRDEATRPVESRILSARLVDKLEGRPDRSGEEYQWLEEALTHTPAAEWTDLRPFTSRLLEFQPERQETVNLLTGIAKQQTAPQALRIASYSAFDDPRLFHFDQPDPISDLVFQTCIQMLSDPDPVIRGAGAALLHNLAARIAGPYRSDYVARAKQSIQAAREHESDPTVRSQLDHFLSLLGRIPA